MYVGAGDLDLGSFADTANLLPNKSSPQPLGCIFMDDIKTQLNVSAGAETEPHCWGGGPFPWDAPEVP